MDSYISNSAASFTASQQQKINVTQNAVNVAK